MSDLELGRSVGDELKSCLEAAKARLYEELSSYPTPITACDVQFDYLIEQQTKVSSELTNVRHCVAEASTVRDIRVLDNLIRASAFITEPMKQRLLFRLQGG